MKCIKCGSRNNKLCDSRKNFEHTIVRRKRKCLDCGKQWVTYEFDTRTIDTFDLKQLIEDWREARYGESKQRKKAEEC